MRREVFEESRVLVAGVAVVGSQPWPVGRYGGCELMLGCMAQARSYEVLVNTDEVRGGRQGRGEGQGEGAGRGAGQGPTGGRS